VAKTQAGFAFLQTEVQLGLTFLGLAQRAGEDHAKADRNVANARKAYDALLHFVEVVEMTDEQYAELQTGIDKIAMGLKAAGDPHWTAASRILQASTSSAADF
jgi:hypothetical protein